MFCRPLMRSPDCGYSSTASSRYMSCSTSKSFASEAAQWRLSASRITFSSILLLPFPIIEAQPKRAIAVNRQRERDHEHPGEGKHAQTDISKIDCQLPFTRLAVRHCPDERGARQLRGGDRDHWQGDSASIGRRFDAPAAASPPHSRDYRLVRT